MGESDVAIFRASTAGAGFAAFREHVGRTILKIEMTPMGPDPIVCDVTVRGLPDLAIATGVISPMLTHHPAALGDDALVLAVVHEGNVAWRNPRGSLEFAGAGAVMTSNSEAGTMIGHTATRLTNIRFDRKLLDLYLPDADAAVGAPIPASHPALKLLLGYAETLEELTGQVDTDSQRVISRNVCDLAALALGVARDARSSTGGVRAARLSAARRTMRQQFRHALTIGDVARQLGISASYLRQLFAAEGMSFADQLLRYRLEATHRLLTDPQHAHQSISSIAYDAGFGDLSYFNRTFRRRYGMTPSEAREASLRRS